MSFNKRPNNSGSTHLGKHRKYRRTSPQNDEYSCRLRFLKEHGPFENVYACAKSFYNEFQFMSKSAANDAFQRTLQGIVDSGTTGYEEFIEQKKFKTWEREFFAAWRRQQKVSVQAFTAKKRAQVLAAGIAKGTEVLLQSISNIADGAVRDLGGTPIVTAAPALGGEPYIHSSSGSYVVEGDGTKCCSNVSLCTQSTQPMLTYYNELQKLNQETTWTYKGIDLVERFRLFRADNQGDFSLALDGIANLTPESKFSNTLPPHVATAINISTRVFQARHYDDVALAIKKEDMKDPVALYMISIIISYSHYFAFHDQVPIDISEHEIFTNLTWPFIQGALTMTKIESRSLEVLITGISQQKNQNKDLIQENKKIGQYADGMAFSGGSQVYLAEASTLHRSKVENLQQDEYKMARAMRDSWVSQIRAICHDFVPPRSMTVFGSCSYKGRTKFWAMDFQGVFRLRQFDAFTVPIEKDDFGRKMKRAMLSCLHLAARVDKELLTRKLDLIEVSYEESVQLLAAARKIELANSSTKKGPRK